MSRFAPQQPDLFAPAKEPPQPRPECDPIAELTAMLEMLRASDRLPWPGVMATMPHELRAVRLGQQAGPEGERLASAILNETERLFAAEE